MVKDTNDKRETLKQIRERERVEKELQLREACNKMANEKHGEDQMKKWSVQHKGLWYLPVMDEEGEAIEALAIMKPIDRHILSYASTKITDEGLYAFLEQCMRECWIAGDEKILDEEDYFIPASMKFNAMLETKKAVMLKR